MGALEPGADAVAKALEEAIFGRPAGSNVAMERLALLTALVLPVTAVASIYGMNVIVSDRTDLAGLLQALVVMLVPMAGMLLWTRRQGWW